MKLIITGATGFIGRNLAEYFHNAGFKVIATGRSELIGRQITLSGIEFRKADILNPRELDLIFEKADYIIHCAAKAGDWGAYSSFYRTNVTGTENIITNCKKHHIQRIIFISTPSVYYSGKNRFNVSEEEALPIKQFYYGRTKLIAEQKLLTKPGNELETIILRPRAVYGKHDNIIFPRILKLATKKRFPLINGGNALVDLTYIDNLCIATELALYAKREAWNQIYNISNGAPIKIKEWFKQVLEIFNQSFIPKNIPELTAQRAAAINALLHSISLGYLQPSITKFSVGYMSKSMTMSIDKAKYLLGYTPRFTNEEGFKLYKKWYQTLN